MTEVFSKISPLRAGLRCRCPRCGIGRLFLGWLNVTASCDICGLDFIAIEIGDGPAVFVMFIVGPLVVSLAFWFEMLVTPPYWVHLTIWPPLILIISMALLRPLKATFIALQFRSGSGETE